MDKLSPDQLNLIPPGLNHSVIWNVGHILTSQQSFMYRKSGLPVKLEAKTMEAFKAGSSASTDVPAETIEYLRANLMPTLEQIEKDYEDAVFQEFQPFETKAGVKIHTIEDAIAFHAFHEGVHLGWMWTIAKLVA